MTAYFQSVGDVDESAIWKIGGWAVHRNTNEDLAPGFDVTVDALRDQALGAGFSLAASVKSIDSLQFQSAHQLLAAVVVDIGEEAQDLAGNVSARRERDVSVDGSRQAAQASQSLGFLGCGHFLSITCRIIGQTRSFTVTNQLYLYSTPPVIADNKVPI